MADAVNWHVKQLARLTRKLRDIPEADGTCVLDHTAMALLFEGGCGPSSESPSLNPHSHSAENMVVLVFGRAGGLKPGQHVRAPGKHPANAVISAMKSSLCANFGLRARSGSSPPAGT